MLMPTDILMINGVGKESTI